MLVTHTWREVVPLFPRFRIVAVSMKRLQIGVARIAAIPIDVIHFNPVVMLEEQPAVATLASLCCEQLSQFGSGIRMPSLSCTPVHPIPVVRAPVPSDLHVPRDRHLAMGYEVHSIGISGRGGKGHPGVQLTPIPLPYPADGSSWMSSVCPAAQLFPGEKVEPIEGCLTHTGAVIVRPAAHFWVELLDEGPLGEDLP